MIRGKTALVTGSTSGIGLAVLRAFAAQGANVAMTGSRPADEAEEARREIETSTGLAARYFQADMSAPSEIAEMIARVMAAFGAIDILVNNAGVQYVAPIEDFPAEKWDLVLAVNLSAAFHAIRAVAPGMKSRRWGRIINMASAHALVASPFKSAYVAAKHGLAGLTKTAALEMAQHGVTVNAIAPGYVWTPLVERQIPETMRARGMTREQVVEDVLLKAQPTREFITTEQVAALALFLASDEARGMTGAILSMDGGWTAQ
ncbi:3-hydroxybutyrate dehydrogenase [Methylocystis sp. JAN1]|uniref:3-hydroxybutyrate dehydrogenase n=1 Tax=Methylocystis sp. JAN1 TaxID=3397211 RepID=UPI003FA24F73